MATRPDQHLESAIIVGKIVQAAGAVTMGRPVKHGTAATECLDAASGENGMGVAMATAAAGATAEICIGGGVVPVRVGTGGTATAGSYAEAGTDGFTNRTIGGGTTVRYLYGQFQQSGVAGDFVGLRVAPFAAGSS